MEDSDKIPIYGNLRSTVMNAGIKVIGVCIAIGVLVIMVIVLGSVVGVEKGKASSAEAQVAELKNVCQEKMCLEAGAWAVAASNTSVQPCDNFYQYACGNYRFIRPLDPSTPSHTLLNDIFERNEDKVVNLLEAPVRNADWAAEKKLKDLFQSCNDEYSRDKLLGRPLVEIINNKLGGWSVFNNFNTNTYDFQNILKMVQDDLWTNAFWIYYIVDDDFDLGKYAVGIYPEGTGRYMSWQYYLDPNSEKIRNDYKRFIRRVAQMLQRDANVSLSETDKAAKVEEFVNDTFNIEYHIAMLASQTTYLPQATAPENRITLADLTTQTGGVIDWVQQATYLYGDVVNRDTKVIVYNFQYLKNLTDIIAQIPNGDKPRILQNYMIWRVLETYIQDLSSEYVHANRELYVDLTGRAEFLGLWRYCFNWVSEEMQEALGALYIMDHFADQNKAKVTDITEKLKLALEDSITRSKWIDSATKSIALDKARNVTYKLGYADDLIDEKKVDAIYEQLSINRSNYMQNVFAVNQFKKEYFKRLLRDGEDRNDWYFRTFDTNMAILWYWNEIIVPAGLLQFPLYDYRLPHAMTFGGLGSIVGHFITHVVDEYGASYDARGKYLGAGTFWWSNTTREAYKTVKNCTANFYNITQGPFGYINGTPIMYRINGASYATEAIAIATGVRLAYEGFRKWETQYGAEKTVPGLGLTSQQTFFLSYAQSYCSNRDEASLRNQAIYGTPTDETRINRVLQGLHEFSRAFQCPEGSNMNPPSKCELF